MGQALYRLETKVIGRKVKDKAGKEVPGKQVSVVAKAAYRAGQSLNDERAARTFNYRSRAQEVSHTEILAPGQGPEWLTQPPPEAGAKARNQRALRERLWNEIERAEKRKDSQLAREFIAALPRGLDRQQQVELVREWAREEFVNKGFVVDFALHKSKKGTNPHAHILSTLRPVEHDGFGKKPSNEGKFNGRGKSGLGAKTDLDGWRESWERHANAALEKAGRPERVDRRSLKDRGIDKAPEPKIGVAATAMKRRGAVEDSTRLEVVRRTRLLNELRPYMRSIKKHGEIKQEAMGATWWERATHVTNRLRELAGQIMANQWQNLLASRRPKEERSAPDSSR